MNGREIKSTSNSANKRSQDQRKSETHKNVTVKTNTIPIMITVLHRWNTFQTLYIRYGAHSMDMCITILPHKDRHAILKTNGLCCMLEIRA